MKLRLKLTTALVVSAAIVVLADEGQKYEKLTDVHPQAGNCGTTGTCTIQENIAWPCDGSSQDACTPIPPSPVNVGGACSWVPAHGKWPGHYTCVQT